VSCRGERWAATAEIATAGRGGGSSLPKEQRRRVQSLLTLNRRVGHASDAVKAAGTGGTKRRESEPPSALSLSASRASGRTRPAKKKRRRGGFRGPDCAPERWWARWRGCLRRSRGAGRAHGADVFVIIAMISSSRASGDKATWLPGKPSRLSQSRHSAVTPSSFCSTSGPARTGEQQGAMLC
jgi:hypothetical protein